MTVQFGIETTIAPAETVVAVAAFVVEQQQQHRTVSYLHYHSN